MDTDEQTAKTTFTKPTQIFKVADASQIYSLAAYKNLLLVGTVATVAAYIWTSKEITKKAWEVKLSSASNKESLEQAEVNSMWLDKINGQLFAGCGDSVMYAINLDTATVSRDFVGHKDYIHCVHGTAENQRIFTASEDGSVKFWDLREKRSTAQLEPYKNEKLHRPELGKWQGTVSVTDDWLVTGGGSRFSLWHLRSLECTTVYPFVGAAHVSSFLDDSILVAGDHSHLYQYSFNGDVTAEVPVSAASVYSVVWQTQETTKFMSIAGSSNSLDICTDFNYKDIVLNLYKSQKKI